MANSKPTRRQQYRPSFVTSFIMLTMNVSDGLLYYRRNVMITENITFVTCQLSYQSYMCGKIVGSDAACGTLLDSTNNGQIGRDPWVPGLDNKMVQRGLPMGKPDCFLSYLSLSYKRSYSLVLLYYFNIVQNQQMPLIYTYGVYWSASVVQLRLDLLPSQLKTRC